MFINVKGRLIDLSHPRVMGIINVTSDSFYEGSRFMSDNQVIAVAGEMLGEGADILDIGGCSTRPGTLPNVPYIMMHMQGTPQTMQLNPLYDDVVADILKWFGDRITPLQQAGVKDIIIDPGFGFGKSAAHNFGMLRRLEEFKAARLPLMVGLSRKSMIWRTLQVTPGEALTGTVALHMTALMKGASILRAHDVREAKEVIALYEKIYPEGILFDHYS